MQQLHLGIVYSENSFIDWLWGLLNNIDNGLSTLIEIVAVSKWELLIYSGQKWN